MDSAHTTTGSMGNGGVLDATDTHGQTAVSDRLGVRSFPHAEDVGVPASDSEQTSYRIVRFCFDDSNVHHREVIASGLSLAEAQAHCQDDSTSGDDAEHGGRWFDGYEEES